MRENPKNAIREIAHQLFLGRGSAFPGSAEGDWCEAEKLYKQAVQDKKTFVLVPTMDGNSVSVQI